MSKKRVGLYLGVASAAAVVVENKRVVSLTKFDLSSFEEEMTDTLNEEIRWEALINRTLRETGTGEKDIYVSITDRDFIFRSFEMPLMRKREVTAALIYEIEKYIPFKMAELKWDYQFTRFPKEKKVDISFVGIRNDNLQKIQDILKRLNLNPISIEPSSLSLIRIIKALPRFSHMKNFAVLDFTKSEAYLTFFYYNLPIFNRYLVIPKKEDNINLEKLIEAVRLSFLYFKREFKFYEPDKIIIIGSNRDESLINSLKEDLQTEIEMFSPNNFINQQNSAVENLKALGIVEREDHLTSFAPVLLTTEEHLEGKGDKVTPINIGLISFIIILGLIVSAFFSVFTNNKLAAQRVWIQLEKKELVLPKGMFSWQEVRNSLEDKRIRINSLKQLSAPAQLISPFLEKLPYFLPQGLWLDNLELVSAGEKYKIILRGNIFLNDAYQERREIDKFILNLKNEKEVNSIFSAIEMTSSERRKTGEFMVTFFSLKLE